MNSVFLIGNFVRDPEVEETTTGVLFLNFTIAVNENYKKADGTVEKKAAFFDCEAWDTGAKLIAEKFKKGDPILVNGKLRHNTWINKDGDKRSRITVRVNTFEFLPRKRSDTPPDENPVENNETSPF